MIPCRIPWEKNLVGYFAGYCEEYTLGEKPCGILFRILCTIYLAWYCLGYLAGYCTGLSCGIPSEINPQPSGHPHLCGFQLLSVNPSPKQNNVEVNVTLQDSWLLFEPMVVTGLPWRHNAHNPWNTMILKLCAFWPFGLLAFWAGDTLRGISWRCRISAISETRCPQMKCFSGRCFLFAMPHTAWASNRELPVWCMWSPSAVGALQTSNLQLNPTWEFL